MLVKSVVLIELHTRIRVAELRALAFKLAFEYCKYIKCQLKPNQS